MPSVCEDTHVPTVDPPWSPEPARSFNWNMSKTQLNSSLLNCPLGVFPPQTGTPKPFQTATPSLSLSLSLSDPRAIHRVSSAVKYIQNRAHLDLEQSQLSPTA